MYGYGFDGSMVEKLELWIIDCVKYSKPVDFKISPFFNVQKRAISI